VKIKNKIMVLGIILLIGFIVNSCGDDNNTPLEEPKDQTTTLNNLFGEGYTATVEGKFTDTEWKGVAEKVETALNGASSAITLLPLQNAFNNVFSANDIVIIVEKTPNGYNKWKTSADGKTMYLSYNALDTDLQGTIDSAVQKMKVTEAGHTQIINHRNIFG